MTNETNHIATPDLTSADAYNADVQAQAASYSISLFLGRGKYANADAASLDEAKAAAAKMQADHPSIVSNPMIVAFDGAGNQSVVGGKALKSKAKPAKKARAKKAKGLAILEAVGRGDLDAPKKALKATKPVAEAKPAGKRAQAAADAAAGKMPAAPDFSAPTHTRFRKKLDEIVALVKKADIDALRAFPINPVSSSPKAMDRYRNLAVAALEAKAAKKAAKAA